MSKRPTSAAGRGPFKKEPPPRIERGKGKESGKDGTTGKYGGRTGNPGTNRPLSPSTSPSRVGKTSRRGPSPSKASVFLSDPARRKLFRGSAPSQRPLPASCPDWSRCKQSFELNAAEPRGSTQAPGGSGRRRAQSSASDDDEPRARRPCRGAVRCWGSRSGPSSSARSLPGRRCSSSGRTGSPPEPAPEDSPFPGGAVCGAESGARRRAERDAEPGAARLLR